MGKYFEFKQQIKEIEESVFSERSIKAQLAKFEIEDPQALKTLWEAVIKASESPSSVYERWFKNDVSILPSGGFAKHSYVKLADSYVIKDCQYVVESHSRFYYCTSDELNEYSLKLRETHDLEYYFRIKEILLERREQLLSLLANVKRYKRHLIKQVLVNVKGYCVDFIRHMIRKHFKTQDDNSGPEEIKSTVFQAQYVLSYSFLIRNYHEQKRKRIHYRNS